jgi:hypothetical protein
MVPGLWATQSLAMLTWGIHSALISLPPAKPAKKK